VQASLWVLDANPDTHDQVRALAIAEEELGRELGIGGDTLDGRDEGGAACVYAHLGPSAGLDSREVRLRYEHVDVRVLRVGKRDRRRPRRRELPYLDRHVRDLTRAFGVQLVPGEELSVEGELGLRLSDPRPRASDLLRAGAVPEGAEALLGGLAIGGGSGEVGLRPVELGLGKGPLAEERARPFSARPCQLFGRDGPVQLVRERSDVLLARARQEQREVGLGCVRVLLAPVARKTGDRGVESREDLPIGDDVAATDVDAVHAPRHLERDDVLVELDEPLKAWRHRRSPVASQEERDGQRTGEKRAGGIPCHSTDNVLARGMRGHPEKGQAPSLRLPLARPSVPARMTKLRLGARGRHHGVTFVVRGRLTLRHTSGSTWSEWYASFADGRGGWIAPAGGRVLVTFEATMPPFRGLKVGKPPWPAYEVEEKGRARYESAEGVLPFAPPFGETYAYADLLAPDGSFATLDYSEDPPRLFIGEATTLLALQIEPRRKEIRKPAPKRGRTR
jgi:uncharacterized protein DUF4178